MLFGNSCSEKVNSELNPVNLRCEYMENPIITKSSPRFSWEIKSNQNNQNQTYWQLIVSNSLEEIEASNGNIWDSGKTKGIETFGITWRDNKLQSFTKYYWKLRAWDRDGKVSNWSKPTSFTDQKRYEVYQCLSE
jgi:alpha-L-rhamnosidase